MTVVVGRLPDWVTAWYLFTRNSRSLGICTTETTNLLARSSFFQCVAFPIDRTLLNCPFICNKKLIKAKHYAFQQILASGNASCRKIVATYLIFINPPLSQLHFAGFLEVCPDLSGLSALQHRQAHIRWLKCRGGAGAAQTHSSRLCNYTQHYKFLRELSDCSDFSPHQQMPSDLSIRPHGKEKWNYWFALWIHPPGHTFFPGNVWKCAFTFTFLNIPEKEKEEKISLNWASEPMTSWKCA